MDGIENYNADSIFHNWFSIEEQKWKSIPGIGSIYIYTPPYNLYRDGDILAVSLMKKLFFLEAMQVTLSIISESIYMNDVWSFNTITMEWN